ncbi:hypothetical protein QFC22_004092 [Naganishia vaughanmartiniae]|uniref:Uncharacterized protein n=1 Tax=Naganishia vaughanmartiniae TaxID=1424756 RepID=A0ACC2X3A9_9TREE|nr:hypothetical protein QFC22_004092 [Naganishia vaughanmartiniae]
MSTTSRASTTLLACLSRPGPSRLAKQLKPCQACAKHLRHASTTSTESVEVSQDAEPVDAPSTSSSSSSSAAEGATVRGGQGYDAWLRSVGRQYKDQPTNGPNWLGGHVPYPTNPTFRPPPPLSDTLKEMIYQEYFFPDKVASSVPASPLAGGAPKAAGEVKTGNIAMLSAKHGISRARVEAVLRLKMMEKEWEKTNKILQIPFQTKMEQYLGVKSPRPGKDITKRNWNAEKVEKDSRLAHPSSSLEQAEENAVDERTGQVLDTSAFSRRDTIKELDGVERNVWEFRSIDEADPTTTATGASAALDVPYNRTNDASTNKPSALKPTPSSPDSAEAGRVEVVGKKHHAYRFVDAGAETLGTKGMGKKQYKKVVGGKK